MAFQREKQRISASEVLRALAGGEDIRLDECTISGDLDVNRLFVKDESFDTAQLDLGARDEVESVTFSQLIVFNSCIFEGNVCFSGPWDKADELTVLFKRDVSFNSSVFHGQSRFGGVIFRGLAGFDGCTFERIASFRRAVFHSHAMFRTTLFEGYGLFNGAQFCKELRFTNTCFGKGGNFADVRFEGRTDFGGCYSKSRAVPIYESVRFMRGRYGDDETFWRFIKQSCQEAGYYQLAGESFYNERCAYFWRRIRGANYDDLSALKKFGKAVWGLRLMPEFVFGRLLFGYGERPVRVLVASVLIILLCASFFSSSLASVSYRQAGAQEQAETVKPGFMDGLYFSTITFTTLGFGDMYPNSESTVTKCVAMTEAMSGACLMALFVVCLSKRFSRG